MTWFLPKGVESLCPHENLPTYVYSSFIHNPQNSQATKMPFQLCDILEKAKLATVKGSVVAGLG